MMVNKTETKPVLMPLSMSSTHHHSMDNGSNNNNTGGKLCIQTAYIRAGGRGSCYCPNCIKMIKASTTGEKRIRRHVCHFHGCEKSYSRPGRLKVHIRQHMLGDVKFHRMYVNAAKTSLETHLQPNHPTIYPHIKVNPPFRVPEHLNAPCPPLVPQPEGRLWCQPQPPPQQDAPLDLSVGPRRSY
jgi:hypothetical protein